MRDNPLRQLEKLGQSIWLDDVRRDLIASGALRRLIENEIYEALSQRDVQGVAVN